MTWPEVHKYVGDFKENFRTGNETYNFPSGDIYEGEFLENKLQGLVHITIEMEEQLLGILEIMS